MDSGHPIFLLFDDELAFLCPTYGVYSYEDMPTGFLCAMYLDRVQSAMDFLSDTAGKNRTTIRKFDWGVYPRLDYCGGLE